jgi:dolichol kinase
LNWLYLGLIGYALGTLGLSRSKTKRNPVPYGSFAAIDIWRLVTEALKGSLLYYIYTLLFGVSGWHLVIAFGAYATGRRFPLYHRFNGEPAIEAGAAFLLCVVVDAAVHGSFPWVYIALAGGVAAALSAARRWQVPVLAVSFLIAVLYPLSEGRSDVSPAVVGVSVYLFWEALLSTIRGALFNFGDNGEIKLWRILARPFALLFVLIDVFANRRALLFVIGIVAVIFIITDFVRLATKKSASAIFKKKETDRFSSMTFFLVSAFLSFLLFPSTIPYVSLVCITFGDFFSKVIGMGFGTIKLYKSRTLQGTLGFLAGSLLFNTLAAALFAIPIIYIIIGSVVAATTELFSESIDDNFSVSIVTGGVLTALKVFLPA